MNISKYCKPYNSKFNNCMENISCKHLDYYTAFTFVLVISNNKPHLLGITILRTFLQSPPLSLANSVSLISPNLASFHLSIVYLDVLFGSFQLVSTKPPILGSLSLTSSSRAQTIGFVVLSQYELSSKLLYSLRSLCFFIYASILIHCYILGCR